MPVQQDVRQEFSAFVDQTGRHLRLALVSAYGPDHGADATADALAYAWEHWDQVRGVANPAGYLYRVGQSSARRYRRTPPVVPVDPVDVDPPWVEPSLNGAMNRLTVRQRTAVVLVRGFGYTLHEVGELLGVSSSTIERHVERGLRKLRRELEVDHVG